MLVQSIARGVWEEWEWLFYLLVGRKEGKTYCVEAKLGANVANVDVGEWLMGLRVPDGHDEGMRAESLSLDDQLCHDGRMVGNLAQGPDPPFGGRQRRRVQREGLVLWVPRRRCLEPAHVRAMAQLRLGIAPDDLEPLGLFQKELVLLGRALLAYCGHEHLVVHRQRRGLAHELDGVLKLLGGPLVLLGELLQALAAGQGGQDAVLAALVVVLGLVKDLLRGEDLGEIVALLQGLFGEEELGQLVDVGSALCALLGQEIGPLRRRRLESLDPVWIGRHFGNVYFMV